MNIDTALFFRLQQPSPTFLMTNPVDGTSLVWTFETNKVILSAHAVYTLPLRSVARPLHSKAIQPLPKQAHDEAYITIIRQVWEESFGRIAQERLNVVGFLASLMQMPLDPYEHASANIDVQDKSLSLAHPRQDTMVASRTVFEIIRHARYLRHSSNILTSHHFFFINPVWPETLHARLELWQQARALLLRFKATPQDIAFYENALSAERH